MMKEIDMTDRKAAFIVNEKLTSCCICGKREAIRPLERCEPCKKEHDERLWIVMNSKSLTAVTHAGYGLKLIDGDEGFITSSP
jgi:hypothetical protein